MELQRKPRISKLELIGIHVIASYFPSLTAAYATYHATKSYSAAAAQLVGCMAIGTLMGTMGRIIAESHRA